MQAVVAVLDARSEVRRHKEQVCETPGILHAGNGGAVRRVAVSIGVVTGAVIALPVDVLQGRESAHVVAFVGGIPVVFQASRMDVVLRLFGNHHFVGRQGEAVAPAAVFPDGVVFGGEAGIDAGAYEGAHARRLGVYFREFGESVAIVVIAVPVAALGKDIHACGVVVRHQGSVQGGDVVQASRAAGGEEVVGRLRGVPPGVLGDDVDGARNRRCPEQGASSPSHDFHPLNHVCRNLLQAVHSAQGAEDGTRVDEQLGVGSVQPVYAHLGGTAILAIVFHPDARLESQSFRQAGGTARFEESPVQHFHEGRRHAPARFIAVGGDHDLIQRHPVFLEFEIHLFRTSAFRDDLFRHLFITYHFDRHGKLPFRKIFQKIVPGGIRHRPDGGAFQHDRHIRQVLARGGIRHVSEQIGVRGFSQCRFSLPGKRCQAYKQPYVSFHHSSN